MNNEALQLVSFEQAKRLKEAGFDYYYQMQADEYPARYRNDFYIDFNGKKGGKISIPTVALALKWFRDEKGIVNFHVEYCEGDYIFGCVFQSMLFIDVPEVDIKKCQIESLPMIEYLF